MLKQMQTHRWRIDFLHSRIFAIGERGCLQDVTSTSANYSTSQPCENCQALLSIREFQTAVGRALPEPKNAIYTPARFVNSVAAEVFARNNQLRDLFAEVFMFNLSLSFPF